MPMRWMMSAMSLVSLFHESLEPPCRRVPRRRHVIEILPRYLEPLEIEREHVLPALPGVADQPHVPQCVQVPGDRLPGDPAALTQPGDRERPLRGEPAHQAEPGGVAQGGEHRRGLARRPAPASSTWAASFFDCPFQPPSFIRNPSARREAGSRSN